MKVPAACLVATHAPINQQASRFNSPTAFKLKIGRARVSGKMSGEDAPNDAMDEDEEGPVRMEASNSVMRMLQGQGGNDPEAGVGLIEKNERKRKKQMQAQPLQIQSDDDEQRAVQVRDELFAKNQLYVPKHDTLFPLLVATFAILCDDDEDEELSETVERFSSDFSKMKEIVDKDVMCMKGRSALASQLFCDVNGDPVNASLDLKFERWFLLSMYVRFKLWWKGPSVAADVALEYAYRMCNFVFDADGEVGRVLERLPGFIPGGRRLAIRYGRLFTGKRDVEEQPSVLLERLQQQLDVKKRGWAAFLMPNEQGDEVACLVTHRTSLIFLNIPQTQAQLVSAFLLLWSALTSFNVGVGQVDSVVEQCAVPVGMLTVIGAAALARKAVASGYGVSRLVSPHLVVPVSQVGAIPSFVYYGGCLPNRACLHDLSAASAVAGLAVSALLIFNSSHYSSLASVMVPSNMFAYSGLLTWLLNQLSAADQGGGTDLVINPLTLGALLGLNFTLFSLLPVTLSDGGRVIGACFGRRFLRSTSRLTFALGTVSLLSRNLLLGFLWALTCASMPEDSFQRDELTEPGIVRKVTALLLTIGAVAAFIPAV